MYSNTASKLAPGIDTRGHNWYVLLPGSVKEADAYTRDLTSPITFAEFPRWFCDLLTVAEERSARHHIPLINEDQEDNVKDAVQYLTINAKPAIEGDGGDSITVATASMLKDRFCLSEVKAFDLMSRYYNPRCQPHWDEDQLETKVRNGFLYSQNAPGESSLEYRFKLSKEARQEVTGKKSRLAYGTNAITEGMEWAEYVVDGIIEREITNVIFGDSSSLKSFMMLNMALCVTAGIP